MFCGMGTLGILTQILTAPTVHTVIVSWGKDTECQLAPCVHKTEVSNQVCFVLVG